MGAFHIYWAILTFKDVGKAVSSWRVEELSIYKIDDADHWNFPRIFIEEGPKVQIDEILWPFLWNINSLKDKALKWRENVFIENVFSFQL